MYHCSFLFFSFFSFWGFSVCRMQICFGFKNFVFFLRPNLEFRPVFTETSRNTRNRPKWPEIFSKWNRNTLDKTSGVATVSNNDILGSNSKSQLLHYLKKEEEKEASLVNWLSWRESKLCSITDSDPLDFLGYSTK